jgi:hypothetical protein
MFVNLKCSGFRSFVITQFNAVVSTFHDWFRRIAMNPRDLQVKSCCCAGHSQLSEAPSFSMWGWLSLCFKERDWCNHQCVLRVCKSVCYVSVSLFVKLTCMLFELLVHTCARSFLYTHAHAASCTHMRTQLLVHTCARSFLYTHAHAACCTHMRTQLVVHTCARSFFCWCVVTSCNQTGSLHSRCIPMFVMVLSVAVTNIETLCLLDVTWAQ